MLSRLLLVAALLATLAFGIGHLALRARAPGADPRVSGPEQSGTPELVPPRRLPRRSSPLSRTPPGRHPRPRGGRPGPRRPRTLSHGVPPPRIERLVSGGQTGVDRGALDAARDLGIPHGGFCPRGRRAEDGVIPGIYSLVETESADYAAAHRAQRAGERRHPDPLPRGTHGRHRADPPPRARTPQTTPRGRSRSHHPMTAKSGTGCATTPSVA